MRADDDERRERLVVVDDVGDVDAERAERVDRARRHLAERVAHGDDDEVRAERQLEQVLGQLVGLVRAAARAEELELLYAARRL